MDNQAADDPATEWESTSGWLLLPGLYQS